MSPVVPAVAGRYSNGYNEPMHRRPGFWTILLLAAAAACGDPGGERRELVVFAAASLRDVATELGGELERRHGARILYNFAGSNTLAQQLRAAPAADVFLSADELWVHHLETAGRVAAGSARPFFENHLVVVVHKDATLTIGEPADLARSSYRHLALGDPEGVPAGRYAKAWLEGLGLWGRVVPRLAPTLDVRGALALVEADPEVVGVVYRTDALTSKRVKIAYEVPPGAGIDVRYWAALLEGGPSPDLGRLFLDFLATPEALEIAARHGFRPPGPTDA